jgi:integrase
MCSSRSYKHAHQPWNKGRIVGQKLPLKPKDVWTIRVRLQLEQRKRDLAMFNLAIDSKLRGWDLVRIGVDDVCIGGRVRDPATVVQKKTGRPVQFEITDQTRITVQAWIDVLRLKTGKYLFPSPLAGREHLSIRQYARLVRSWIERAGLEAGQLWHTLTQTNQKRH